MQRQPAALWSVSVLLWGVFSRGIHGQSCLGFADSRSVQLQLQAALEGYDVSGLTETSLSCCGGGTFDVTGVECADTHCGEPRARVCPGNLQAYSLEGCRPKPPPPDCGDGEGLIEATCIGCGSSGCADTLDECYPCAAGKAGTGGTCSPCPPGTAPNVAKTSCASCSLLAGTGYIGDGYSCTRCERGTAPDAEEAECVSCPTGRQSEDGEVCESCGTGEVPNSMRTGCTGCSAGSFADLSAYFCADCPTGKYSRPRAVECQLCEDGFEADTMGVGCVECRAGQAGVGGICAACPTGWAPENMYGSSRCADCATFGTATYSDTTQCLNCDAGRQVRANRAGCDGCPAGQASEDGAQCNFCASGYVPTGLVEAGGCYSCGAGTYASTTSFLCEDCDAGKFSLESSPECYQCDNGYGVNPNGGGCVACAAGEVSTVGICEPCAPGTAPSSSRDECEACDSFGVAYANSGSGVCERCPAGRSPNEIRDACVECSPGHASADGTPCAACASGAAPDETKANCVPCSGGRYAVEGAVLCAPCPLGKFAAEGTALRCASCADGLEPSTDQSECLPCASGTAGAGGTCVVCFPGRAPNTARTTCGLCSIGKYSAGELCTACWPGSEPTVDGDDCVPCGYGKHSTQGHPCMHCAPGSVPNNFEGATACTTCRIGRFSDDVTFLCQECHPGTYAPLGSGECLRCDDGFGPDRHAGACVSCSPGRAGTNSTCRVCEPGTAPSSNRTYCEACEATPGGYADETLNRCAVCAPGRAPSIRRDFCMDCTFGLHRSDGMDNCSTCSPGFEPDRFAAASRCLPCMDGYVSSGEICLRCMEDSAPDAVMSSCVCKAGYAMNDRRSSCNDVDECTAVGNQGICNLDKNITVHCCSQFSGCSNYPGGFECLPCMAGFIGDGYGLDGCAFAASAGRAGSIAEAPEPSVTLRMGASEAVIVQDSEEQAHFMRLVVAEVSTVLQISRDFVEVTAIVASEDVSGAASTECQLTLSTDYDTLPSVPVFEADVIDKLATLLGIDPSRVELTGIYPGSTVIKFILLEIPPGEDGIIEANRTDSVADLLQRLETVVDPANWRSGDSIRDYFATYQSYEGGRVSSIVDVTFKIASGATADDDRTVVDLLYQLNDAVRTGSLGALRLPSGQDVFDSLVLSCPVGTYQEPTQGCIPCPPGSQPTEDQMSCIACAAWATLPNRSSVFSIDGRECKLCPAGKSPDARRVQCETCPLGRAANGLGEMCSACQDRTMAPSLDRTRCMCTDGTVDTTRLSGYGRHGVSTKQVIGRCIPCIAGYEADGTQSSCVKCASGKAKNSEVGICILCEDEGKQASTDGTICLPCDGVLTTAGENACRASALGMFLFVLLVLGLGGAGTTAALRHYLRKTGNSKYGLASIFAAQKYALQVAGNGGDLAAADPSLSAAVMQEQLQASSKQRKLDAKHAKKAAKDAEKEAAKMLKMEEKEAAKVAKEEEARRRQETKLEEVTCFAESGTMVTPRLEHGEHYYEELELKRQAEDNAVQERYGEKNEKWQTWLARYIDPEMDVDDYLQKIDMPEGWQPRGAARISSGDGDDKQDSQPPPPPLPIDGVVPRNRRAATGESTSSGEEESSGWYDDAGSPGGVIYGQMPSGEDMLMPGSIPVPPAAEDTEALIVAAAEREREAKAEKDRLKEQKLQSWKQNRHHVVAMPPSLTSALGAHRPVSAAFSRVDVNYERDGKQKADADPLAHLRFRGESPTHGPVDSRVRRDLSPQRQQRPPLSPGA